MSENSYRLNFDTTGAAIDGSNERRADYIARQQVKKEVYQMYGEYLENLRKPYPKELLEAARSARLSGMQRSHSDSDK